jgi:hypothetical protein
MKYLPFAVIALVFAAAFRAFALTVEVTAIVPGCGDGIVSAGEQCDGSNFAGASCSNFGFSSGTLSCTLSCTISTASCSAGSTATGGGGGGGPKKTDSPSITAGNVVFSGRAYPLSKVTILKDGQVVVSTIAGPDSIFSASASGLSTGNYNFSVYGEDDKGNRSSLFTFPIYITAGMTTKIGGIFIAPTIAVDKREVRQGENIAVFGQTAPSSEVTVSVNSPQEFFFKQKADSTGAYLINIDTTVLEMGQHTTKSKASIQGEVSSFGKIVGFRVGTATVPADFAVPAPSGDMNGDSRVNLVDLSMAGHWYRKPFPPSAFDLNGDGVVNLVDLSILASNWTG